MAWLRSEGQFRHQAIGVSQNKVPLLSRGVGDAATAHGLQTADEELEAHEVIPNLHRKAVRLAIPVVELFRAQQVLLQVHPPDICYPRSHSILVEIIPDSGDIVPGDFIQQILFHATFLNLIIFRRVWLPGAPGRVHHGKAPQGHQQDKGNQENRVGDCIKNQEPEHLPGQGAGVEDRQVFLGEQHHPHQQHRAQQEVGPQHQHDALPPILVIELPQPGKDERRKQKSLDPLPHASVYPKPFLAVKAAESLAALLKRQTPGLRPGVPCLIDSLADPDMVV
jgi:hypothetical protein